MTDHSSTRPSYVTRITPSMIGACAMYRVRDWGQINTVPVRYSTSSIRPLCFWPCHSCRFTEHYVRASEIQDPYRSHEPSAKPDSRVVPANFGTCNPSFRGGPLRSREDTYRKFHWQRVRSGVQYGCACLRLAPHVLVGRHRCDHDNSCPDTSH